MTDENFRHIVRVANTDLKGEKGLAIALQKIEGVGTPMAHVICSLAKVNPLMQTGTISDSQVAAIDKVIENPKAAGVPLWYFNRQKDYETGEDLHLFGPNRKFVQENDVKRMSKTKSYRGLRHQWGLTVRGQRTQSNFRNKKRTGGAKRKK